MKLLIFSVLGGMFLVCSGLVYTIGTRLPQSSTPLSAEAKAGKMLWQKHNCVACHQFYGLGGFRGPDLTNVISKKGEAYSRVILANGTEAMPNYKLSETEIDQLLAYLAAVDKTGVSPVEKPDINLNGTVNYPQRTQ